MRRTDDFLADLEGQLAAAGRRAPTPARRRRIQARPLLAATAAVAAVAAVAAFVLAAGSGIEQERAADPGTLLPGTLLTLPPAVPSGDCAPLDKTIEAPPPAGLLARLAVLRRPQNGRDRLPGGVTVPVTGLDTRFVRRARGDAPVTLVPTEGVVPRACSDGETRASAADGPGVCAIVEFDERRTACWTLEQIERGEAVAALRKGGDGTGFVIALVADGVEKVRFIPAKNGIEDAYEVTDNVIIAGLDDVGAGDQVRVIAEQAGTGCGGTVPLVAEGRALPDELRVAVPVLGMGGHRRALSPEARDFLERFPRGTVWIDEVRRLAVGNDGELWVVPVLDMRLRPCDAAIVDAPRGWDGAGVCLVAMFRGAPKGALCADLDDLGGVSAPEIPGGRLAYGFLPHGATSAELVGASFGYVEPTRGVFAGVAPPGQLGNVVYAGPQGSIDPADVATNTVVVVAADPRLAEAVRDRVSRAGIDTGQLGEHPPVDRSRVMFAAGMAPSARQIAELLRIQTVLPLDEATADRAGPQADVVVVAGSDLAP